MGEVIELDDYRPYDTVAVICLDCRSKFLATIYEGMLLAEAECPECGGDIVATGD